MIIQEVESAPLPPTHNVLPISTQAANAAYRETLDAYRQIRTAYRLDPTAPLREPDTFSVTAPEPGNRTLGRLHELSEIIGREIRINESTVIPFDARHYNLYRAGLDFFSRALKHQADPYPLEQPTNEAVTLFAESLVSHEDGIFNREPAEMFVDFLTNPETEWTARTFARPDIRTRLAMIDQRHRREFEQAQPDLNSFLTQRAQRLERMLNRTTSEEDNRDASSTPGVAEAFTLGCIDGYFLYQAMVRMEETQPGLNALRDELSLPPQSDVHPEDAVEMGTRLLYNFGTILEYTEQDRFVLRDNLYHELIIIHADSEAVQQPKYALFDATGADIPLPQGITEPFWIITEREFGAVEMYEDTPFGTIPNIGYDADEHLFEFSQAYIIDSEYTARKIFIVRHLREAEEKFPDLSSLPVSELLLFHEYDPALAHKLIQVPQDFPERITIIVEGVQQRDYDHLNGLIEDFHQARYLPKALGFGEDE